MRPTPVTPGEPPDLETWLVAAGANLQRIVSAHEHPQRQELQDIADFLLRRYGDPGSPYPARPRLPNLGWRDWRTTSGADPS